MRNVDSHILEGKMDEAVNHYMASHHGEPIHVDGHGLSVNVQDDGGGRVVTVMHPQNFSSHMCRQVSVGVGVGEPVSGQWEGEELLDTEGRIAALVAHLTSHPRHAHHAHHAHPSHPSHPSHHHNHKVQYVRSSDVDTSVILDTPSMRLFNGQSLDQPPESIVVEEVHQLPALPPLQEMKLRSQEDWFNNKPNKAILKDDAPILTDSDGPVLELGAGASPAQTKQNKKSLPHKKRISRKLKRNNGSSTPQQPDIVVINCTEEVQQEEILPDNFVAAVQHQPHIIPDTHHIAHEMRPLLLCQLCGEFYGEEQLKFYQHLKQHYEPHAAIIIESPGPVPDLAIDKMTNTCIVDNVATLPDSIVELSLESTVPKTMYQPIDKHILYTSSDKALSYSGNKMQYSMASMDKEPVPTETEKSDIYDTLDKLEVFSCGKCSKSFRKQKQCEAHIKEAHSNTKLEDIAEFSEPEDLMEGIHVAVEEGGEQYEQTLLPHLTVDNGHVHQEHIARHWYMRNSNSSSPPPPQGATAAAANGSAGGGACGSGGAYCPVCPPAQHARDAAGSSHLKEEVLQRMFETEVSNPEPSFTESIIPDNDVPQDPPPLPPPQAPPPEEKGKKKPPKKFDCNQCGRVFLHRNSLMYHLLSHSGKQHFCRECGKGFYTAQALMVHKRTHSGDRPCKCDECGREFRQRSDLRYHKVSIHSNQKQFKCEFCNKEFARKYSLSLHRRIHTGERNYKCEYCNKTFRASAYRLNHMRTHTGDKPYKCADCGKCFRVGFDLRRHQMTHDKARARLEEKAKRDQEKPAKLIKLENIKIENIESITEEAHKQFKKNAVASTTTRPAAIMKNVEKKSPRLKKNVVKKDGAPNVTVGRTEGHFKVAENADIEVFEMRQDAHYTKFKDVYSDHSEYNKVKDYGEQVYKDSERASDDRDMIFRSNQMCDDIEKPVYRGENTDGKLQVYMHREKKDYGGAVISNSLSLGDIRHLEREVARDVRTDLHGENIENGFLERLTALYNVTE